MVRVALVTAAHPELFLERVLDRLVGTSALGADSLASVKSTIVAGLVLDAENLLTRGAQRAELTHFTGDAAAYSRRLHGTTTAEVDQVVGAARGYVTRDRARALLVTPVSAAKAPDAAVEAAFPVPLDEAPPTFGADAIRRYVHPPGVNGYRRVVLDNGMEVILGRRAGPPVAAVGLSAPRRIPPRRRPRAPTKPGASSSIPRSPGRLTPSDYGGQLWLHHGRDALTYVFQGAAGNVANMLNDLAERAPAMRVDPMAVQRFDRDTIPFLARAELAPEAKADRALWAALYGEEHPYGRTVSAAVLAGLGAGDANGWVEQNVVAPNAVLAVVGEIDPAEVEGMVRQTFGRWSVGLARSAAGGARARGADEPGRDGSRRRDAGQHRALAAFSSRPRAPRRRGTTCWPASSGSPHSRPAPEASGATYGIHASVTHLRGDQAHLVLTGDVDNEHLAAALAAVRRAFILLGQGHFKDGEVEAARWRAARAYGVRYMTNASVVNAILATRNQERDLGTIDAYPEGLLAVTPEALQADFAFCAKESRSSPSSGTSPPSVPRSPRVGRNHPAVGAPLDGSEAIRVRGPSRGRRLGQPSFSGKAQPQAMTSLHSSVSFGSPGRPKRPATSRGLRRPSCSSHGTTCERTCSPRPACTWQVQSFCSWQGFSGRRHLVRPERDGDLGPVVASSLVLSSAQDPVVREALEVHVLALLPGPMAQVLHVGEPLIVRALSLEDLVVDVERHEVLGLADVQLLGALVRRQALSVLRHPPLERVPGVARGPLRSPPVAVGDGQDDAPLPRPGARTPPRRCCRPRACDRTRA